jgi:hypothetical protein
MSHKLLILSFCNILNDNGYHNYVKSLKKFKYNYKILGKGVKWEGFVQTKIKYCYDYLKTLDDNDNLVICVTDVLDMLAIAPPEELYKKFLEFKKPIVIGAEQGYSYLTPSYEPHIKLSPSYRKRKFVNAGFYIGYKKNLCDMYEYILSQDIFDDQICVGKYIYEHQNNYALDYRCKIIHNIDNKELLDFKNHPNNNIKRLFIKDTKKFPCFIHGPGLSIVYLNKILQQLYPNDNMKPYKYTNKLMKNWLKEIIFIIPILIYLFLIYKEFKSENSLPFIFIFLIIIIVGIIAYIQISTINKIQLSDNKKIFISIVSCCIVILIYQKILESITKPHHSTNITDLLNKNIFNIQISGWSYSHFIFYAVLGYYYPHKIKHLFIIGITWEIIEYITGTVISSPQNNIDKILSHGLKYSDKWWGGCASDLIYNYLGLLVGSHLAKIKY